MATIAVDLDGPCYEWQRTYRYMMREYRGVHLPRLEDFWYTWNAPDAFTTQEDRDWLWTEGVRLGLFRHGHVSKGAIIGLRSLQAAGHKLLVVTHRPEAAVRDTINWLDHHFGGMDPYPWANVHILTSEQPKYSIEADILIDDKAENVHGWSTNRGHSLLYDAPWNQDAYTCLDSCPDDGWHVYRAEGWTDVVDRVARVTGVSV